MADLKINAVAVKKAADNIKMYNSQILEWISESKDAVSRLNASWDGEAAAKTISQFYKIDSEFSSARYNIVDNYVNFLLQQVGEGYIQTEGANKSLANQIK